MTRFSKFLGAGLPLVVTLGAFLAFAAAGDKAAKDKAARPAKWAQSDDAKAPQPQRRDRRAKPAEPSAAVALARTARQSEAAIRKSLQKTVTQKFEGKPLNEVLAELSKSAGSTFWIDRTALLDEEIEPDEPVTIDLREATIQSALERLLDPMGMAWVIDHEVLVVTTKIAADEMLITCIYNVAELLPPEDEAFDVGALPTVRRTRLSYVQFNLGGQMGGSAGQGGFGGPWVEEPTSERQRAINRLIDVIEDATSGPWEDIDGTGGTIDFTEPGLLIVRQTAAVQDEVELLIDALKDLHKRQSTTTQRFVFPPGHPTEADRQVLRALKRTASIEADAKPLAQVLDDLAKKTGIQIVVDERALSDEGIETSEPITEKLSGISLHALLELILDPLGLTHYVEHGVLNVTTKIEADERFVIALYDVRPLLSQGVPLTNLIEVSLNETRGPWEEIDGTGGTIDEALTGVLVVRQTYEVHDELAVVLDDLRRRAAEIGKTAKDDPDPEQIVTRFYTQASAKRAKALQEALKELIAPETWESAGGEGVIRVVENTLVVRQSHEVQKQVQRFLDELRAAERHEQGVPLDGFGGGGGGGGGALGSGGGFF
ncbi:MAG: hypothetical protein KY476_25910 [Planctomycetes bacterium]|nr:hypothetical protein [Planctomycetota bacterium]